MTFIYTTVKQSQYISNKKNIWQHLALINCGQDSDNHPVACAGLVTTNCHSTALLWTLWCYTR